MKKRRRLTPQQKQENVSRHAFSQLLDDHQWVAADVSPDLGEDILVRIYNDDGESTGISFFVQLKSIQDIERCRLRSGLVSYSFKVKDLEHWEVQGVPVLLVLWDVRNNQGRHLWVKEAIKWLNQTNADWREKKKVSLHFPENNSFDEAGFLKLRRDLALHYYEIISDGRAMVIQTTLEFPPTPRGQQKLQELERHLAAGDPVEVPGEFIRNVDFSDWWARLFGPVSPGEISLSLGLPKSPPTVSFQFDFFSPKYGIVRVTPVLLKLVKGGDKEITITNAEQNIPETFEIIVDKASGQMSVTISINFGGTDGYEARRALRVQRSLANGAEIRLTNLETSKTAIYKVRQGHMFDPQAATFDFVEKICKIQDATGVMLRFPNDGSFTRADEDSANELMEIIDRGRISYQGSLSMELRKPGIVQILPHLQNNLAISFRMASAQSHVEILGSSVALGPMTKYVKGAWQAEYNDVQAWLESATDQDALAVNIQTAEVEEVFPNWLREEI